MIRRKSIWALIAALVWGALTLQAQNPVVEARIAGLESNERYMDLLREDARLQIQEDSVTRAVEAKRHEMRSNPAARKELTAQIIQLENRIFAIRNAKGHLIDQINSIEQEYVFANLSHPSEEMTAEVTPQTGNSKLTIPEAEKRRNLVMNPFFKRELQAEDYEALRQAQRYEEEVVDLLHRYRQNYATKQELAAVYDTVSTEAAGLEIAARFEELETAAQDLVEEVGKKWNYVFDNKDYAYGYLLDKLSREKLLVAQEQRVDEAQRSIAAEHDNGAAELVDYYYRKQALLAYESDVAELLHLDAARDSLQAVAANHKKLPYRFEPVALRERSFIVYDTVRFSAQSIYTYQNPIPECRVYAHGRIYRLLVGTFNTKRAAALFHGASPLSYLITEAGKWQYFVGGFATREEAEKMVGVLRKRGFTRPEVVVWVDGVMYNLAHDEEAAATLYRVEIGGLESLSEELKQIIRSTVENAEISRAGSHYIVGPFNDRAVTTEVVTALKAYNSAIEAQVAEVAPNLK